MESDSHESFTDEEQQHYERRYKGRYNIYDAKYLSWLKINHPEANLTIYSSSFLDYFTYVGFLDPVSVCEEDVSPQ